jgi:hypothetical protein
MVAELGTDGQNGNLSRPTDTRLKSSLHSSCEISTILIDAPCKRQQVYTTLQMKIRNAQQSRKA